MTNTYAINTTRNQEFAVEQELQELGLHPWVPRFLASTYVKEKRQTVWYDRPYLPKFMISVIPAIYWPDVVGLKHVIGKPIPLTQRDIDGAPAYRKRRTGEERGQGTGEWVPELPGLRQFEKAVSDEYSERERLRVNSEYQCQYQPGQALELLAGPFEGFRGVFEKSIKQAHDNYHKLRLSVEMFGRVSVVEVDPDKVGVVT